jgi:DNA-binding transcriptional regulator LsrR (DeoR family)
MLKRANEEGIVRISLSAPKGTYPELENILRDKYNIIDAVVVDCAENRDAAIMSRIGEAAAHFLESTIQCNEVIGISSWSETILRMIDNVHPMPAGTAGAVVQTLGGLGNPNVQKHATHVTTRLSKLTGAEPVILQAPAVAASKAARDILAKDKFVQKATAQFSRITLAFLGIGAVKPSGILAQSGNIFSKEELQELSNRGAVAEISQRFLDAQGKAVETRLNDRVIGISLPELAKIDRVVALAGGKSKTEAIRATIKSDFVDVLITDRFTAARLAR